MDRRGSTTVHSATWLAQLSHVCPDTVPRRRHFVLHDRPSSYGFETLDVLLQQLRNVVADGEVFAEVLAALHLEGRQLDVAHLASELQLNNRVGEIVEHLAVWGDAGFSVSAFGARCIARVHAGSLLGHTDLTTFIFAQRRENGFELFFEDENGGRGDLGEYTPPLSLLELTVVINGVPVVRAPYDVTDGDWRSGYFAGDPSMTVRVTSSIYDQLEAWYEQVIEEWLAAREGEEG